MVKKQIFYLSVMLSFMFITTLEMNAQIKQETQSPFIYEKGNTTIKLGGFIRTVAFSDFNGSIQNYDFINSTMYIPNNWEYEKRTSFDASSSRINIKVTQTVDKLGPVDLFFEMDFRGANDVLRLRHAYLSFLGFTFGQTWSFWYDGASTASTIDVQGVNSRTFHRTPLLGYSKKIGEDLSFGISLEFPKAKITTMPGYKAVNQNVPDIPFYVQYKGKMGHLKAAAIYRSINYGVTGDTRIKSEASFGVQLSGSLKTSKLITLYSNGIYGRGVARYINDLAAQSLDLVPNYENGKIQTIPMWSASVGARADFSKNLYFTANYSVAGIHDNYNYYSANEFLRGNYLSSTLFYNVAKNLIIAGEYIHGMRENMNLVKADANRIQMMFMYTF